MTDKKKRLSPLDKRIMEESGQVTTRSMSDEEKEKYGKLVPKPSKVTVSREERLSQLEESKNLPNFSKFADFLSFFSQEHVQKDLYKICYNTLRPACNNEHSYIMEHVQDLVQLVFFYLSEYHVNYNASNWHSYAKLASKHVLNRNKQFRQDLYYGHESLSHFEEMEFVPEELQVAMDVDLSLYQKKFLQTLSEDELELVQLRLMNLSNKEISACSKTFPNNMSIKRVADKVLVKYASYCIGVPVHIDKKNVEKVVQQLRTYKEKRLSIDDRMRLLERSLTGVKQGRYACTMSEGNYIKDEFLPLVQNLVGDLESLSVKRWNARHISDSACTKYACQLEFQLGNYGCPTILVKPVQSASVLTLGEKEYKPFRAWTPEELDHKRL